MKEIWKDIRDFENLYLVSNLGHIKSRNTQKLLNPTKSSTGYLHVQLYKNHKAFTRNIHRLVALAFIPNPENKPQVNHIDGDKANNCIVNLEWVSRSENQRHAVKNGLMKSPMIGRYGKDNPLSKAILQYSLQGEFIKEWASISDAAREMNCNQGLISACINERHGSSCGYLWKIRTSADYPLKIEPYTPKIAISHKYKKHLIIHYGIVNAKTVPIDQYSLKGEFIKTWESMSLASRFYGVSRYKLNKCCKGTIPSLNGFIWKYKS